MILSDDSSSDYTDSSYFQPRLKLTEQTVTLKNKLAFTLRIPQSYKITPAAEGLERPRFFAKSPDGRLFITDMHYRSDNKKGRRPPKSPTRGL